MVVTNKLPDGRYEIRGRTQYERAIVPHWPCSRVLIRQGCVRYAPKAWLAEVEAVADDLKAMNP